MKYLNILALSGSTAISPISGLQIDAQQLYGSSFHAIFGDNTAAGVLKLQASNDPAPTDYSAAMNFTVTNWSDITSSNIVAGAPALLTIPQGTTYRWLRAVFTTASAVIPAAQTTVATPSTGTFEYDVAVDPDGNIFAACDSVLDIVPAGGGLSQIAAAFTATSISLDSDGNLFAGDLVGGVIYKYATNGPLTYDAPIAAITGLTFPWKFVIDTSGPDDVLYVASNTMPGGPIVKYTTVVTQFDTATDIDTVTGAADIRGICVDSTGNVYSTDFASGNINKLTWDGMTYTRSTIAVVSKAWGIAVDSNDALYVASNDGNTVKMITSDVTPYDTIIDLPAYSGNKPTGLAVDSNNVVYVARNDGSQVINIVTPEHEGPSSDTTVIVKVFGVAV